MLRLENAALRAQNADLQEQDREPEARLSQNSSDSSRPPSLDPPHVPLKRRPGPSVRNRGGRLRHRGAFRALLSVEQVDQLVAAVPKRCRHCGPPFPETAPRRRSRVWRHQVVEFLPLAVQVIKYQMSVRRCLDCGKRTRADLPAGVPRRPFGARLTAVIALLSGRYRLSRREVRQEQAESAALAPVVEEARPAVQQAAIVNMNETGWQQQRRAWLWTAVTAELTMFCIDRSWGGAAVEALLGPAFTGVVGSDHLWRTDVRDPRLVQRVSAPYMNPNDTFDRAALATDCQWLRHQGGLAEDVDLDQVVDETFVQYALSVLGPYH